MAAQIPANAEGPILELGPGTGVVTAAILERGIAAERIAVLESWVQRGFAPDLTLLFDVPPEVAEARRSAARTADRFEREADSFFGRVRNAYLDRARAEPARIRVLDARRSIAELQADIGQLLQGLA